MTSRLKKDGEEDKNRHLLENFLENFSIWQTHNITRYYSVLYSLRPKYV